MPRFGFAVVLLVAYISASATTLCVETEDLSGGQPEEEQVSCRQLNIDFDQIKRAEAELKATAKALQKEISDALNLIRGITSGNVLPRTSEVLEVNNKIENRALLVLDELAMTGPFMNVLNDVRVEIRQKSRGLSCKPGISKILEGMSQCFADLGMSISRTEGKITLLLSQFSRLKRDMEPSISTGGAVHLSRLSKTSRQISTPWAKPLMRCSSSMWPTVLAGSSLPAFIAF